VIRSLRGPKQLTAITRRQLGSCDGPKLLGDSSCLGPPLEPRGVRCLLLLVGGTHLEGCAAASGTNPPCAWGSMSPCLCDGGRPLARLGGGADFSASQSWVNRLALLSPHLDGGREGMPYRSGSRSD
ncbi:hypothetical protein KI387_017376, partial [Taxus chinensis]